MKNLIILIAILLSSSAIFGQKSSEIVQKGIEVKRFYEQNLEDGDKVFFLDKEEHYDFRGEIVELKEYSNKGKEIKLWMKYKFDDEGNLIEELELNSKGEQKIKFVYKNNKGLRIERNDYDEKNRLIKVKKYEYGYRK